MSEKNYFWQLSFFKQSKPVDSPIITAIDFLKFIFNNLLLNFYQFYYYDLRENV